MSGIEDTGARLAAIKDISTERLIELAQAEAAGLVTISTSPAEIYQQATTPEDHQARGFEMVTRELERLASLDLALAKGTIGTSRTIAIIREALPFVRAAAALLRTYADAKDNELLPLEKLREIDGYVWVCYQQATFGTHLPPEDHLNCSGYKFSFSEYGKTWFAYLHPPKE